MMVFMMVFQVVDGGRMGFVGGGGVSPGSVAGARGAKVSCPMSSIMSESVDPVALGLEEVRSGVGQGSPATAASRLSPIAEV